MGNYIGHASYPRASYYPSYGMYAGGSMFAYGAVARMCHRVAYYESRTQGYWGNNPAAYYVQAMGAHAASIARPGGNGGGSGNAAGKAQGDQAQKAPDAAPQNTTKTTGGSDDGDGKAKETEDERKARAKQEAEQQKVDDAKAKLKSLKETMPSKLQTEYGYTEDEANKIVEMVHDKVKDSGVEAPNKFANYLNGIPKKKSNDPQNPITHEQWAWKYGQWVANLKGADKPDRATSDAICTIKVLRGKTISDKVKADYARVEAEGIRKADGVTYNRYRVLKKQGRGAEGRIGSQSAIYHDPTSGKWGTIVDDKFIAFRPQPKKWDKALGLLDFGGGKDKLVPVPIKGLSATDINTAIDNWVKQHGTKADIAKDPTKSKSATVIRAHDVAKELGTFFGKRNGELAAKVEVEDGKNVKINASGKTADERGRNADFIQRKILANPDRFKKIVDSLDEKSAVTVNGTPVADVHGAAAADNTVAILAKTAITAQGPIDVRRPGTDPDKKFLNLKGDQDIIYKRVEKFLGSKDYRPDSPKWQHSKKMVVTLRFGKEPDAAAIKAVEDRLNKGLRDKGHSCTIEVKTVVVDVDKLKGQKADPRISTMLKLAHWAADGSGDAKATAQEERLLKGSTDADKPGLPFSTDRALAISYKALQKKAREMHADNRAGRVSEGELKDWMTKAVAGVKAYKGDAEVERFKKQAGVEPVKAETTKHRGRRRSARYRRSRTRRARRRGAGTKAPTRSGPKGGRIKSKYKPTSASTDTPPTGTMFASRGNWLPIATMRNGSVKWRGPGDKIMILPSGIQPTSAA